MTDETVPASPAPGASPKPVKATKAPRTLETGSPEGEERFAPTVRPGAKTELPNGLTLETF